MYNVLTGLPVPAFVLAQVVTGWAFGFSTEPPPLFPFVALIPWIFFGLACYPRLFLPLVRRHRPDWQSPLLEANLLKKALEKTVWLQILALMGGYMLLGFTFAFLAVFGVPHPFRVASLFALALYMLAVTLLALQARKAGDPALERAFWVTMPAPVLSLSLGLVLSEHSFIEALFREGTAGMLVGLLAPPLVVGLVRLFAPRRWLVK